MLPLHGSNISPHVEIWNEDWSGGEWAVTTGPVSGPSHPRTPCESWWAHLRIFLWASWVQVALALPESSSLVLCESRVLSFKNLILWTWKAGWRLSCNQDAQNTLSMMCMCIHVVMCAPHMCLWVQVRVWACLCEPQVEDGHPPRSLSQWTRCPTIMAGQWASAVFCLHPSAPGLDAPHHTEPFTWVLRIWTPVFMLTRQKLYWLSHLPSLKCLTV